MQNDLKLGFNLDFEDLYDDEKMQIIDNVFISFLKEKDSKIANDFLNLTKFNSSVLSHVSCILEEFIAELFNIKNEVFDLRKKDEKLNLIHHARLNFVQRYISKKFTSSVENVDGIEILKRNKINFKDLEDLEDVLSKMMIDNENIDFLEKYSAWALYSKEGKKFHQNGSLFILPQKIDYQNLILNYDKKDRDNFELTDRGFCKSRIQAEANYCIFCHNQGKDSCNTGLHSRDGNEILENPLKNKLSGCPLNQKISEMNYIKSLGFNIGALAMAIIDNPMIAATGHRICNDCMKSCIFQKQDPVEIPQIETGILKDVLSLPYGFEIYSLLTRWNPLNIENKFPKKHKNKRVLVCGLGPAGYTLSHYLLNDGFDVVAIDGLKIESLDHEISGIDPLGIRHKFKPIKFFEEIYQPNQTRLIQGFGGVAEYGITVRWDKNYLTLIRLILERRKKFRMFGGLRFGSSIDENIAFDKYNFDHIALCLGAGKPNILDVENNFSKGVFMASDFLMSLQMTGAFKEELPINLQIRMPIMVVGGGLTAVDSACESRAYYFLQIKKFAKKVEEMKKNNSWNNFWQKLSEEEKIIAQEFIDHHNQFSKGITDFAKVRILYRKNIQESPSYKLNHQELSKAFSENIELIENTEIKTIKLDCFQHLSQLQTMDDKVFECKTLIVATGTSPNISIVTEDNLNFQLDGKYFKKTSGYNFITKILENSNKAISFFGDLHPNFEGNVVKAMASAKNGYKEISSIVDSTKNEIDFDDFIKKINNDFLVKIHKIERLSNHVVQISIHSGLLASVTEVGQIFRLQNYHKNAKKNPKDLSQKMVMEPVAVTALEIDKINGIISGIVVETGGSTSFIKNFQTDEPCIFMGPSGKPTEFSQNETVVLIGGGRGNQPLTTIANALLKNNCRVIFFAGYRKNSFIVNEEKMKNSCSDLIISIEDEEPKNNRFKGSVIDSIKHFFKNNPIKIDRVFTIGNSFMMHEVAKLRHDNLIESFANAKFAITSLNSPMQCMMKGVCSRCLQKKVINGSTKYFYSCANQDQNIDEIDFVHLHARNQQNSLLEKINNTSFID